MTTSRSVTIAQAFAAEPSLTLVICEEYIFEIIKLKH